MEICVDLETLRSLFNLTDSVHCSVQGMQHDFCFVQRFSIAFDNGFFSPYFSDSSIQY